jgi:uncharacterized SAM-binding protein YcdF (DUF218 family)
MFFLKKAITPLFYPFPIITLLLLTGLAMLWFTGKQKAGKIIATLAICLLLILSYDYVPDLLLAPLENRYPPFSLEKTANPIPPVKWIVVLGGGYTPDPSIPLTDQVSSPTLKRIVEGIRIHKSMPGSRLVLSGGPVFYSEPEAKVMMKMAKLLGIDEKNIVLETLSRDTEEQALYIKQITGKDRFILVTSAYHMPRSMRAFKGYGSTPIAAPVEKLVRKNKGDFNPQIIYPSLGGLNKTAVAIHEYLGLAWFRLKMALMSAT